MSERCDGRSIDGFNDHDLPGFKTTNHIAVVGTGCGAWFRDTEGDILCSHELSDSEV